MTRPALTRLALLFAADGFIGGAFVAYVPTIVLAEHLRVQTVSTGFATIVLGGIVGTLLASKLPGKAALKTRMAVVPSCLALVPFGTLHSAFLLAWAFAYGFGRGAFEVSLNTYATQLQHAYGRAILSRLHGGFSLGMLGGAISGSLCLALHLTVLHAFVIVATSISLGSACLIVYPMPHVLSASHCASADVQREGIRLRSLVIVCAVILAAFACAMTEGAIADWSGLWLIDSGAGSLVAASAGLVGFNFAMAATRLGGDRLTHTLGGREPPMLLGSVFAAGALLLARLSPTSLFETGAFFAAGIGLANIAPSLFSIAGRIAGWAISLCSAASALGFFIGPLVIGLASKHALHDGLYVIAGTALAVCLAATVLFRLRTDV